MALPRSAIPRFQFRKPPNLPSHISKRHVHPTKPSDPTTTGTSIPVPNTVAPLSIWYRLGPLSRGFQAYGRSQRKRPYTTQFVSSLVIYFLGDLSAQKMNGDRYDPVRSVRALVISAGSSIWSYKWYIHPIPPLCST
jgi:protein Mpv17